MTEIQLAYGKTSVGLSIDESRHKIITTNQSDDKPLSDFDIGAALETPIDSSPFDELFSAGDSVLIVVSDATRATASAQIINLLVRRLIQVGISTANLAIIFATGIHRTVTPEEKSALLTPFIVQRVKTLDHDPCDSAKMVSMGKTDRGTPVELNRALSDYTHVVITGAIGFHYFAGFTGGRKSICPGLASARTIEATHMLALDFESGRRRAGVDIAKLKGNAVHEECEQIAALVGPRLGINSVVDERNRAVRVYSGNWRKAHATGCREYLVEHSVVIDAKREVVLASCGGSPYDINLIQAHKALEMAAHACLEGGDIILLAECEEGLGRPDFLKWFDANDSADLGQLLRKAYEVNGQTAWSLLAKAERYRVHLVSKLPEAHVRRMRMTPWHSLDEALASLGKVEQGYIMPRGAVLLPRLH